MYLRRIPTCMPLALALRSFPRAAACCGQKIAVEVAWACGTIRALTEVAGHDRALTAWQSQGAPWPFLCPYLWGRVSLQPLSLSSALDGTLMGTAASDKSKGMKIMLWSLSLSWICIGVYAWTGVFCQLQPARGNVALAGAWWDTSATGQQQMPSD